MPPRRTRVGRVINPPTRIDDVLDVGPDNNHSLEEVATQLNRLTEQFTHLSEAMAEIQQCIAGHPNMDPLRPIPLTGTSPEPRLFTTPMRAHFESNYAYVDESTKSLISSGMLDASHLVKLIPPTQRSKTSNVALTGNHLSFNLDTLQPVLSTNNSAHTALKHFPDFYSFAQALTIYAAIRDIYDSDHLGYAAAIQLHLHLLATWCRQHLGWPGILNYAIAFFTKYQRSSPLAWAQQDVILYNTHITVYTQTRSNALTRNATSIFPGQRTPSETICLNFNTANKGCHWDRCLRKHLCSSCRQPSHPAYHCPTNQPRPPPPKPASINTASSK